jgi:transketolase N-terminal domain/subunit
MVDKKLKKRLLEICYKHKLHHLGSYFSSLNIIDEIYSQMKKDDIFILSSGHAVVALFVVLEKYYGFDAEELLKKHGEHPKLDEEHKIFCSTGSLGLGLLVAVGRAVANRDRDVYCLISDGETAEGSIWEALRYAKECKLENLKVFVNANGICGYDTVNVDYLEKRIKAFDEKINFVITTVEQIPALKGIESHYCTLSEKDYLDGLEYINRE